MRNLIYSYNSIEYNLRNDEDWEALEDAMVRNELKGFYAVSFLNGYQIIAGIPAIENIQELLVLDTRDIIKVEILIDNNIGFNEIIENQYWYNFNIYYGREEVELALNERLEQEGLGIMVANFKRYINYDVHFEEFTMFDNKIEELCDYMYYYDYDDINNF